MFTDVATATVLTVSLELLVFADVADATVLTVSLEFLVFADVAAATVLPVVLDPLVFAEADTVAVLTPAHLLLIRLCGQSLGLLSRPLPEDGITGAVPIDALES